MVVDGDRQWEREREQVSNPNTNTHLEMSGKWGRKEYRWRMWESVKSSAGVKMDWVRWIDLTSSGGDSRGAEQLISGLEEAVGVEEVRESQRLKWGWRKLGGEKGISWAVMSQGGGLNYKADLWLPGPSWSLSCWCCYYTLIQFLIQFELYLSWYWQGLYLRIWGIPFLTKPLTEITWFWSWIKTGPPTSS